MVWLTAAALATLLPPPASAQNPAPLLYLPFDGTCEPGLAAGGVRVSSAEELALEAGMVGQAARLAADCRYEVGDLFPVNAGTFAAWIRPNWPGDDPQSRTLMCIYGPSDQPDPWRRNRWSVTAGAGSIQFSVYPREGGQPSGVSAPIAGWRADEWHHIAAVWAWLGSKDGGVLRLYLDGVLSAEETGLALDVGQPGSLLDIGRDSDASPDYAEALYDEVFLYPWALTAEQIVAGVQRVREGQPPVPEAPRHAPRAVEGWDHPDRPYRAIIDTVPPERERTDAWFEAALALSDDLRQLGLQATPDPNSHLLTELPQAGSAPAPDLTHSVRGGRLSFLAPGATPAGEARHFALYFDVIGYEHLAPLLVVRQASRYTPAQAAGADLSDYATSTYDDAWDFDEGDTEAIDRFGDKPEYFRDVRVEDGVLKASVTQDPYFIWGSMWGPEDQGERRVRIDVDVHNVLEMRVSQSVPSAQWVLYGRSLGSERLQSYKFRVEGTGWQTVRIDLQRDAHWGGVLSAFRIDPTEEVHADIAIDWVRLLSILPAECRAVELLGNPSATPAKVELDLAQREVEAGHHQPLTIRVTDAEANAVSGQPVHVALREGPGGALELAAQPALATADGLRGLTDADGSLTVTYAASTVAKQEADTLVASTEFPAIAAARAAVDTKSGPPARLRVLSDGVTIFRAQNAPFAITFEPVDRFGNRSGTGYVKAWRVGDGRLELLPNLDDEGRARALFYPDMANRWVYTFEAETDRVAGASGPICVLPARPRPQPVSLGPNGYFRLAEGKPYLPLGGFYINWVGLPDPVTGEEGRILKSFTDASEPEVLDWLNFLHRQGVNTLRLMLRTHTAGGLEPMDVGGRVNLPLFAQTLRLMDLARPFGIRFLLVIHDDYDKPVYCNEANLERFSLPRFAAEDLDALPPYQRRFIRDRKLLRTAHEKYTDPDAMRCQDDYARELISYVRDNPQVFGYELENEMVDCPREWAEHAVEVIRSVDPDTPICASHGGGGIHTADPRWWTTQTPIDFYTYHLYPIGSTDETTDYGAAVLRLAKYGQMAGTCFLGESSGDEFSQYPANRDDERRFLMRDTIWMSLIAGNPGCMFWNARGYEVEQFRLAREVTDRIDWTRWQRQRPEIAVVVDHPLADDKYYRSPQGTADRAMMGRYCQHFLSHGLDFDFALQRDDYAHVADLRDFAPPAPTEAAFTVTPGFQLASLTREGETEGLLYIRNLAVVREWTVPNRGSMWLRERAPAPLTVGFHLPDGRLTAKWWDLDTGATEEAVLGPGGALSLGETEHDFAVHWQRG